MATSDAPSKTAMQRFLDGVETVGNMVPHPVVIFLILIGFVIVLSALLSAFGAAVSFERINPDTNQIETATTERSGTFESRPKDKWAARKLRE